MWQRAHAFVMAIYQLTAAFPKTETYGLAAQARRAAVSIPANIAEGFGRATTRELLRSLQIARGELEETRCFMLLSCDLGRVSQEELVNVNAHCDSVGQLINALGRALKARLEKIETSRVTSHKSRVTP